MNHRELLHSFDQIAKPDLAVFAPLCKTKVAPKSIAEVRECLKSNEIDCERFAEALRPKKQVSAEEVPAEPKPRKAKGGG